MGRCYSSITSTTKGAGHHEKTAHTENDGPRHGTDGYNLERLMLMSGQKTPGRVVDKLVREKMLALRGRNIETEETK